MHRFVLYIIITGLLAQACQENHSHEATERKNGFTPELKTKEDSLYHDVMQGHDVGMAKIGKVRKYLDQIQHALDSLKKLPAKNIDAKYRQALTDLQEDLSYADFSMNKWMEEFKLDSAKDNSGLRIKYLQSEKEKVTKVKDGILTGLQRADSLLKKN
jgi:paraquat-inducible protein B